MQKPKLSRRLCLQFGVALLSSAGYAAKDGAKKQTGASFRFRGDIPTLFAVSTPSGYAVESVAAPLDATGVMVLCSAPPKQDEMLRIVAEGFNAEWNGGIGLQKSGQNRLGTSITARSFEKQLWLRILTEGQDTLSRLAALSRKSAAYWQSHPPAPGDAELNALLQGDNFKFLSNAQWHALLRLYDSLNRDQRRTLVAEGGFLLSPTPAQLDLLRTMHTSSGPYYHDSREQSITREQHLQMVEGWVAAIRASGYHTGNMSVRRDPITRTVTVLSMFTLPPRDWLPFPVRGCPFPDAEGRLRPEPSYADWEQLPFPTDLQARKNDDGAAWMRTLSLLATSLPESTIIVSDDYPAAEAYRRRVSAASARGLRRQPYDPTGEAALGSPKNLAEGLDALCRQTGRVWWRSGNTLFFRSQFWCSMQRYAPPPKIVKAIHATLADAGVDGPTNEQAEAAFVALADFTPEQFVGFVTLSVSPPPVVIQAANGSVPAAPPTPITGSDAFLSAVRLGGVPVGAWDYVQFFRRLTPVQRRQALHPTGMAVSGLSESQQAFVPAAIRVMLTPSPDTVYAARSDDKGTGTFKTTLKSTTPRADDTNRVDNDAPPNHRLRAFNVRFYFTGNGYGNGSDFVFAVPNTNKAK